jgi:colanic acid biosynthesis glycosyl transferase WcaI
MHAFSIIARRLPIAGRSDFIESNPVRLERRSIKDRALGAAKVLLEDWRDSTTKPPTPQTTRILIHGINYAPELIGVGRYTTELAEYLAKSGHVVEVITAPPHYPGWWVRSGYQAHWYSREYLNGVKIYRCPLLLRKNGQGFWRLFAPLSFAIAAAPLVAWRILRGKPDTVICIEPTLFSAPVAALVAKVIGAKRALHVQDLEVDAAFAVGHLSTGLKRIALAFERVILRRFETIITISERMRERLLEKRVPPNLVHVVRNWVDLTRIKPLLGANRFRNELRLRDDDFVVLYAGHIGPKQALHLIFKAAEDLFENDRIQFVIAGDGPLKSKFVAQYGGLPNVHFLPLQPEEKLCELLNLANLHVLPQDRNAADLVLPSKLGGTLATGRPLLVQADEGTELHGLLNGIALVVPAGDVAALARTITDASIGNISVDRYDEVAAFFARDRSLPIFRDLIYAEPKLMMTRFWARVAIGAIIYWVERVLTAFPRLKSVSFRKHFK